MESLPSLPSPYSLPTKLPSRSHLVSTVLPICVRLKSIVSFIDQVANQMSNDQIEEGTLIRLKTETFPSMCDVDIELKETSEWISSQMDRSRVSDPSLKYLLEFFKYTKEMMRIVEDVSSIVYSDVERVLEERERGLIGVSLSHTTHYSLKQMRVGLNRALTLINNRSHA